MLTHEDSIIFSLYFYKGRAQNNESKEHCLSHMRTASFSVFTFTKEGLKTTKVKSTACASKKIKTNHRIAFLCNPSTLKSPLAHVWNSY